MNVSHTLEDISNATAPAIVLLAPFIHFLVYHQYGLAAPEVLILLGGVAIVGAVLALLAARVSPFIRVLIIATVIMFFFDVQFDYERHGYLTLIYVACIGIAWMLRDHVTEIAFAVFLTFIASTLILGGDRTGVTTENRPDAAAARNETLPPIIHLILDEHIGIEGIPADIEPGPAVKSELKQFYADNGFALFGGAFSQYSKTYNSIANALNFTSESQDAYYFPDKTDRYILKENEWFESLGDAGYQIRVYQSDYLDLCQTAGLAIVSCTTYPGNSIKSIEDLDLPAMQKARFIAYSILDRSDSFDFVRDKYNGLRSLNGFLEETIPPWNRGADRVGPLGIRSVFQQMSDAIPEYARGTAFVAHLNIPHYPYVYDRNCDLIPDIDQWLLRADPEAGTMPGQENSQETRRTRYALYLEQMRCLNTKLGKLFDRMRESGDYEDAIIILHGDHGSRIAITDPKERYRDQLIDSDYSDAFSTLFAVKKPDIQPVYDSKAATVQDLLLFATGKTKTPARSSTVFLRVKDRGDMVPQTLPR